MKRSNRLVLLIGIFLALVAFVLIVLMFSNGSGGTQAGPSASPTVVNLVVAARDIPLGATIQEGDLTLREFPLAERPADSYTNTAFVAGQVARQPAAAGQLITSAVTSDVGGVRRLDVPPGKVAMSIKVNQVSGVGTVIKAGDYVDAVVGFNITPTYTDPATGLPKAIEVQGGPSVKALLQGMQVLGTLLPTPPQQAQAQPAPSASANTGSTTTLNDQEQIVILAVTLQQAEVLNYSQISGITGPNGITLVLRSSEEFVDAAGEPSIPPDVVTTGVVLRILVEQYGVLPPIEFTPLETPRP